MKKKIEKNKKRGRKKRKKTWNRKTEEKDTAKDKVKILWVERNKKSRK